MKAKSNRRRTAIKLMAPLVALGLIATACGSDSDDDSSSTEAPSTDAPATDAPSTDAPSTDAPSTDAEPATTDEPAAGGPPIRIRGQDFSESITIAEVYGQYLQAKGYDVEIQTPAGFRTEAIASIENGDVDLIIDYIGGSLTALVPDAPTSANPDEIAALIGPAYEAIGATLLPYSSAVDGDALIVRGDSEANTISDVAGLDYVLGASAACFEREQCFIGYTSPDVYNITFADTVTLEFGPLLGEALIAEEVDAVVWNTTAPQITVNGFKVLEDDLGLHPAQNIAPIINSEILAAYGANRTGTGAEPSPRLSTVLDELTALITTDDLVAWNTETDIELRESDAVATEWLESKGLI